MKTITRNLKDIHRIVAFGDSITYGVASPNLINAGNQKYISLFCDHVGATLNNNAVSGSTIAKTDGGVLSIYDKVTSLTAQDVDIIVISGGVNDFATGHTLFNFDANRFCHSFSFSICCCFSKVNSCELLD